jgi:hypothetical protein
MPAGGFSVSAPSGVEFEAKITPIVIISCIMAATGGLMFGYDVGISGTPGRRARSSSPSPLFLPRAGWFQRIMRNSSCMKRQINVLFVLRNWVWCSMEFCKLCLFIFL